MLLLRFINRIFESELSCCRGSFSSYIDYVLYAFQTQMIRTFFEPHSYKRTVGVVLISPSFQNNSRPALFFLTRTNDRLVLVRMFSCVECA